MITVIVPVYNVEKYIRQCLDSIISQTYKDLEIILVDDGSTDSSGTICDEYAQKDARVKVIHKENGGLSSARNAGLNIAQGEYITFVDSDDTIELDMIDCLFSSVQEADVVICKARIVREGEILKPTNVKGEKSLSNNDLWEEIFCRLNNSAWGKLYRRSMIEGCCFPEGLYHGEDLIFNLQYLSRATKGVFLDAVKYNYFKRKGSITTQIRFTEKAFDEVIIKDRAFELVEKVKPEYYSQALCFCFVSRMNVCRKLYKFNKTEAYSDILQAYNLFFDRHYREVKSYLGRRKLEFFLFKKFRWLWRIAIKIRE